MASKPTCVSTGNVVKEDSPPKDKDVIRVRATLFFDGTLNNMFNSDDRKGDKDAYHQYGGYRDSKDRLLDPKKDSTSYGNEYSNVAQLKTYLDTSVDGGYKYLEPIYVEGIGTVNHGQDDKFGYVSGTGDTGIEAKVEKGISDLKDKINKLIKFKKSTTKITELRLDVFGFSRGAAAARHFIHRMLYEFTGKVNLKTFPKFIDVLRAEQYDIDGIKIHFAGLFDTVSSHGIWHTSHNLSDVKDLGLDTVKDAEATFHITAADEHRRSFALTDISSAAKAGKGREISLPGVHSDIGGSYQNRVDEYIQVYDMDFPFPGGYLKMIEADLTALIHDGWFRRSDIVNASSGGYLAEDALQSPFRHAVNINGEVFVSRRGKDKKGIRNLYCRIPLHLMKAEAMKHQLAFQSTFESKRETTLSGVDTENNPIPPEIKQAYAFLKRYAQGGASPAEWAAFIPLLKILRHDYFHFSANWKEVNRVVSYAANAPRYEGRVRKRQIHKG